MNDGEAPRIRAEQSLGKPMKSLEGSGVSEQQNPKETEQDQEAARGSSLAPPLLLISCVSFGKLLTLSGP